MSQHRSIADIPEAELIQELMQNPHWRSSVLNIQGFPSDAKAFLEISLSGLFSLEGDIDILLVSTARPNEAIAVQAKRIKVTESSFRTEQPNKLKELEKLWHQTNALVAAGFSQIYCVVLIVVDSRANNDGVYKFDGLSKTLDAKIRNAISTACLHENAGLVTMEFVQPVDDRPLGIGTFHLHLVRQAQINPQAAEVTDWILRAIAKHDSF